MILTTPIASKSRATISAKCLKHVSLPASAPSHVSGQVISLNQAGTMVSSSVNVVNVFAFAKDLVLVNVYLQAAYMHHESSIIIRKNPHCS